MSQLGMVAHWRRSHDAGVRLKLYVNAVGALATTTALCIVIVSKFSHGAWITALVIPGLVLFLKWTEDERLIKADRECDPPTRRTA